MNFTLYIHTSKQKKKHIHVKKDLKKVIRVYHKVALTICLSPELFDLLRKTATPNGPNNTTTVNIVIDQNEPWLVRVMKEFMSLKQSLVFKPYD